MFHALLLQRQHSASQLERVPGPMVAEEFGRREAQALKTLQAGETNREPYRRDRFSELATGVRTVEDFERD